MTAAQLAAREQVSRLTLKDIGRRLNTVAADFLAFCGGDVTAAKRSIRDLPVRSDLSEMLCLAIETVAARRERQINRELDGFRVRRGW